MAEWKKFALTESETRKIEEKVTHRLAISLFDLMERAGQKVAEEVLKNSRFKKATIICGKGNNGGDGLVCARHLIQKGLDVKVFLLSEKENLSPDSQSALKKLQNLSVQPEIVNNLTQIEKAVKEADVVIDAIFGIGFKGETKGLHKEVIETLNNFSPYTVSIDIPSGVEADSGHVHGSCVRANETITFTAPKVGLLLYPALDFVGKLVVRSVGIPSFLVESGANLRLPDEKAFASLMPKRSPEAHKKSVGKVLVIAGSKGMTGAATLASEAALKMGVGVVTLGIPESLNQIMEVKLTEIMTLPLPETNGSLNLEALDKILSAVSSFDVVALGPGLSTSTQTVKLVKEITRSLNLPLVLDADGLNALADSPSLLRERESETIITPHPGELSRLLGVSTAEIQEDRLGWAKRAAKKFDLTVVLKGAKSVISSPSQTALNLTGNPGMASAGTGDVLTGFIASLWAQGLSSFEAAFLGTYLHGLSGDIALEEMTEWCLTAQDLINYLPKAIKELLERGKDGGD